MIGDEPACVMARFAHYRGVSTEQLRLLDPIDETDAYHGGCRASQLCDIGTGLVNTKDEKWLGQLEGRAEATKAFADALAPLDRAFVYNFQGTFDRAIPGMDEESAEEQLMEELRDRLTRGVVFN